MAWRVNNFHKSLNHKGFAMSKRGVGSCTSDITQEGFPAR